MPWETEGEGVGIACLVELLLVERLLGPSRLIKKSKLEDLFLRSARQILDTYEKEAAGRLYRCKARGRKFGKFLDSVPPRPSLESLPLPATVPVFEL